MTTNHNEKEEVINDKDWKQVIVLVSEAALSSIVYKTERIISDVCKEHGLTHSVYLDIKEKITNEIDIFQVYESELWNNTGLDVKVIETTWKCLGIPKKIIWDVSNYNK